MPDVRCELGEVRVALRLDRALAAAWSGPQAAEPFAADVDLALSAAAGPLGDPAPFGPETPLISTTCRIDTARPGAFEALRGLCRPDAASLLRALRLATQPALLRRGWVLLHAATVRFGDAVHVCAAPSGTGKTTLARRVEAAGGEVWGDEVALVSIDGAVAVHPGQPRSGPAGARGRLAAIHVLGRGEPGRAALRPAAAVARLMRLQMVYEAVPETAGLALEALGRLVTAAPVFATLVPDDARAMAVIRDGAGR